EIEIRTEFDKLSEDKTHIEALLGSEQKQWGVIATEVSELRKTYGPDTELGKRRATVAQAPDTDLADIETAMIEREPITVVLSEKGWIRALKGHNNDIAAQNFKSDDRLMLGFTCETTDKLLMLTTGGRVYTLGADKLPGGRGHGEPVRIMVDIEEGQDIVDLFVYRPGAKRLIVSDAGNGFKVAEDDMIANTRKGKQVLNVSGGQEARLCVPAEGDMVAVIGQNRRMLVFPAEQLPEMTRGKGVRLQRYKDGGVSDARMFMAADGLTWTDSSNRTFTKSMDELRDWIGDRAQAGRQ